MPWSGSGCHGRACRKFLADPSIRIAGRCSISAPPRRRSLPLIAISSSSIAKARANVIRNGCCAISKASCCSTATGVRPRRCGGAIRGCSNAAASFSARGGPRAMAACAASRAATVCRPSKPPRMLVSRLEARPEIEETLNAGFERLLERYRATRRSQDRPRRPELITQRLRSSGNRIPRAVERRASEHPNVGRARNHTGAEDVSRKPADAKGPRAAMGGGSGKELPDGHTPSGGLASGGGTAGASAGGRRWRRDRPCGGK